MTWFLGIRGPYSFTGELLNQKNQSGKKMESRYQIYQKRESYTAFITRYRDVALKQLETTVCKV